ncbi:glycosyltransferase family 9 protein [Persephonella sp.]
MKKVLLFQPGPLGDSFFTSALADIIKKEMLNTQVYFYTTSTAVEMVKDNPNIDGCIVHSGNILRDIKNLRQEKFDVLIDTWAVGDAYYRVIFVKSEKKLAIRKKESEKYLIPFVYTEQVIFKKHGYVFWDRLELLKAIGINIEKYIKKELPVYHVSENTLEIVKNWLKEKNIYENSFVLITPKGLWKTKDIPIELASNLVDMLGKDYNMPVVLAAPPSDRNYIEEIKSKSKSQPLIFSSKSIREFGALIKMSKHLISVESLPYHLAVGLRKSATVVLGGYPIWKPENYDKLAYVNIDMGCKFCASKSCKIKTYECLHKITPTMILQKADRFLK